MTLLAKAEDSFALSNGCVIIFRFLAEDGRIHVNDQIRLLTPEGRVKDTYVAGIEIWTPKPLSKKQDAPPGTEIWFIKHDESHKPEALRHRRSRQ